MCVCMMCVRTTACTEHRQNHSRKCLFVKVNGKALSVQKLENGKSMLIALPKPGKYTYVFLG